MHRRDAIRILGGLLGVSALANRRALAAERQEILLAHLYVAGTSYYNARRAARRLRPGQRLTLRREPGNHHDALAIELFGPAGHKLGYVPRASNEVPARLMDSGRHLSARAESIARRGDWLDIRFALYMDAA